MNREIPIDELHRYLDYSPETGVLTWRARDASEFSTMGAAKRWNKVYSGQPAGTVNRDGYIIIKIPRAIAYEKLMSAHRAAWAIYHGKWPSGQIDHINGVRDDNRIDNMRDVSQSVNMRNARMRRNNKSGVNGVSWCKKWRKWVARISHGGRKRHLGAYGDKACAITARKAAEIEHGYSKRHGAPTTSQASDG